MLLFGGICLRLPDAAVFQFVGQELLAHEVAGVVVGIFIVVAIAKLFHQFGGGVAQVQGNGQVAGLPLVDMCKNSYYLKIENLKMFFVIG